MSEVLKFLKFVFICYRLARLIAIDEGPATDNKTGPFMKLRIKLGAYNYNENGEVETNLGRFISCPHCVGVWIALPLAFLMSGFSKKTFVNWLAIAGGSSFLWSIARDNE